jgi:type II secretory pathway predicted ATPase ExeA
MLLNYQIPQKKLLNILLFGQTELERRITAKQNLADRVDLWIRLEPLDLGVTQALLEYRLSRAGLAPGQRLFSDDARDLIYRATGGLPRRITTLAHSAMVEASERGSTGVFEEHVRSAALNRGLTISAPVASEAAAKNGSAPRRSWFERLLRRDS